MRRTALDTIGNSITGTVPRGGGAERGFTAATTGAVADAGAAAGGAAATGGAAGAGRSGTPSVSGSAAKARTDSLGGRSASRKVVLRSAEASRLTCCGVSASVTVVMFWLSGLGVALVVSTEFPIASTSAPRKIADARGTSTPTRGGTAITSTRSPGWISPATPLTRSIEMLTARMPIGRRAGNAFAPAMSIFDRVTMLPAGIVMREYLPTISLRSVTASGSTSVTGREAGVTSASLSSTRAGTSCAATNTVRIWAAALCGWSEPR